jgi:hypothetical protein
MNIALKTGLRMTTALLLATGLASGNETVSDASGFRAAVAAAKPGMRILLAAGQSMNAGMLRRQRSAEDRV